MKLNEITSFQSMMHDTKGKYPDFKVKVQHLLDSMTFGWGKLSKVSAQIFNEFEAELGHKDEDEFVTGRQILLACAAADIDAVYTDLIMQHAIAQKEE